MSVWTHTKATRGGSFVATSVVVLVSAAAASGCPPEPATEDAPDPRGVDAFVPSGLDAGPTDAAEPMLGDAFDPARGDAPAPTPDVLPARDVGSDAAISPADDCARSGYPPLALVDVAPGFDWVRPVYLTSPPRSSDLYVVDARGYIYLVRSGAVQPRPFLDISSTVGRLSGMGDERGLLGLAFHPDYATNGRFFIGYTPVGGDNYVAEGRRSATDPDVAEPTLTTVLRIPDFAANHNGGGVEFGPDGFLYVGTGDGGGAGDPRRTAQDPGSLLGKMLRIDVNVVGMPYAVPTSNPFVGMVGVRGEIWALGYRNPWRFSFDRLTGDMYVGDVGQDLWEEVDFEPAGSGGRNYGWSAFEGTHAFSGGSALRTGDTHTPPIFEIRQGSSMAVLRGACSVTGGYVYRGSAIPSLRGAYIFGDYCSNDVAAFRYCGGEVREPSRLDFGRGVSGLVSFGQDAEGELYVVSFGSGAEVRRIVAR